MRKNIILLLIVGITSFMFVGCNSKDGLNGSAPKYFEIKANKDINIDEYESISSKIYDINNDGILEELEIVNKDNKSYILIKHAEKGYIESTIELNKNSSKIEKISDVDGDGIEEIFVSNNGKDEEVYAYNYDIKGFELKA